MMSGVTCQVRLARLLKPDSLELRFLLSRLLEPDMQPVLPFPGVPGVAFEVQFGMVLYNQSVWSKSLFVSKKAPTMPRARQSSGVLTRISLLRCSLRSVSRQVVLGE